MISSLRRLWPYLQPHKYKFLVIIVTSLIISVCASLIPYLGKLLIDEVFTKKNADYRYLVPIAFPILYLAYGTARYYHFFLVKYSTELVITHIRENLLHKFVRLNLSFYNSFKGGSGGLLSRVFNDTAVLQEGLYLYADLVREPLVAIAVLGYMFWSNWKLTTFALIFLPIFTFVLRSVRKSLKKYGHQSREAMEGLTGTLKESLDGVRVIQSFNLEDEMQRRFLESKTHYLSTRKKIASREEAVSPVNEFLVSLFFVALSLYITKEIFADRSSVGDFMGFLIAAGLLQAPVKKLQNAFVKIQQPIIVIERIFDLLDHTSQVPQAANPKPFPVDWKTIRFENVSFTYGSEYVLKNVNITINRGEVVALVGESGSGKSTLVNMLERFFDPTEGRILLDDTPLDQIDLKDLRKHIALVTQDVFLFRDTIEKNIQAGDFSKDPAGVRQAAQMANADAFISNMTETYQSQVGERGSLLSGGERQRVSIARAIFKDAPILILDEATSALDSISELEVQKGLNHLMTGRTAFVIAHRLSTVFNANRILVLKKGEIIEEGSHEVLLSKKGEYFNFFQLQMNHTERAKAQTN